MWDPRAQRVKFLYLVEGFEEIFEKSWSQHQEWMTATQGGQTEDQSALKRKAEDSELQPSPDDEPEKKNARKDTGGGKGAGKNKAAGNNGSGKDKKGGDGGSSSADTANKVIMATARKTITAYTNANSQVPLRIEIKLRTRLFVNIKHECQE